MKNNTVTPGLTAQPGICEKRAKLTLNPDP